MGGLHKLDRHFCPHIPALELKRPAGDDLMPVLDQRQRLVEPRSGAYVALLVMIDTRPDRLISRSTMPRRCPPRLRGTSMPRPAPTATCSAQAQRWRLGGRHDARDVFRIRSARSP